MKIITAIILALFVASCANGPDLDTQLQTLEGHVEKSSSLRGTFCNGEAFKWYFEGKYSISGTCANGMVFHLPLYDN